MEAGAGTLTRMSEASLDLALLVVEPSAKSIDVAQRSAAIIAEHKIAPTLVVANRVRDPRDLELIRAALPDREVAVVPEDAAISEADREGRSPVDTAPDSPGVQAIASLAARLSAAVATGRHQAV